MDNFHEYLNGLKFTLYRDTTTESTLGTTQLKTLNRLQTTMNNHDFEIKDRQRSDLPEFLRKGQTMVEPRHISRTKNGSKIVHVDEISTHTKLGKTIISITYDSQTFSTSAVIPDSNPDSTISAIWIHWCKPYGFPETISFKQGKVQTSKLEKMINDLTPLEQKVSCRSRKDTFNTEIERQWQQNTHEISEEEFVHALNFLCNLQKPANRKHLYDNPETFNDNSEDLADIIKATEDGDELEADFEDLLHLNNDQPIKPKKRKNVSLCRHKLQGRIGYWSRNRTQSAYQPPRITDFKGQDTNDEWAQLIKMERFLEEQRLELLQQGAQDSGDKSWNENEWTEELDENLDEEKDDSLEDEDITFITSVLDSLSNTRNGASTLNRTGYEILTPEGATARAQAKHMAPPKFHQKFNQQFSHNSTIKSSALHPFSCFPTILEERSSELSEYLDEEEYDSLEDEDTMSESDEEAEFKGETHNDIDIEEANFDLASTSIYGIWQKKEQTLSAWQPYSPQQPVFRSSSAPSWWSHSSPLECSSPEPTPTRISSINYSKATTKRTPIPPSTTPIQVRSERAPQHIWKPSRPATKHCKHIWNKNGQN